VLWWARTAGTLRRARSLSGRPAPPPAAGRRWPGGCADRRSLRAGSAVTLNLAEVGFALADVSGDDVNGDVGSGGIEDEADRLAFAVPAGQGQYARAVASWPGLLGEGAALPDPLVELGEHHVSPVDLIAGGSEVLTDWTGFGAPVDAVFQEPDGLRLVGVGAGAGAFAQLSLEVRMDRSGFDDLDQAAGEFWCLGPGSCPAAGRPIRRDLVGQ
jgi:hypothetical protein